MFRTTYFLFFVLLISPCLAQDDCAATIYNNNYSQFQAEYDLHTSPFHYYQFPATVKFTIRSTNQDNYGFKIGVLDGTDFCGKTLHHSFSSGEGTTDQHYTYNIEACPNTGNNQVFTLRFFNNNFGYKIYLAYRVQVCTTAAKCPVNSRPLEDCSTLSYSGRCSGVDAAARTCSDHGHAICQCNDGFLPTSGCYLNSKGLVLAGSQCVSELPTPTETPPPPNDSPKPARPSPSPTPTSTSDPNSADGGKTGNDIKGGSSSTSSPEGKHANTAIIAGAVGGGVGLCALVVAAVLFKRSRGTSPPHGIQLHETSA